MFTISYCRYEGSKKYPHSFHPCVWIFLFSIAHLFLSTSCHDRVYARKFFACGRQAKKMLTKKKKNTISTCLMMILKFAFTIQLFLFLVSFFFIHVVAALPCTWKNWGENGKFSRALQKISHCGRIEERCCAFNLFFLFWLALYIHQFLFSIYRALILEHCRLRLLISTPCKICTTSYILREIILIVEHRWA